MRPENPSLAKRGKGRFFENIYLENPPPSPFSKGGFRQRFAFVIALPINLTHQIRDNSWLKSFL